MRHFAVPVVLKAAGSIIILSVLATGCIFNGSDGGETTGASAYCAADYLPLTVDAQWTYQATTTSADGSVTVTSVATTIANAEHSGGVTWYLTGTGIQMAISGNAVLLRDDDIAVAKALIPFPGAAKPSASRALDIGEYRYLDFGAESWTVLSETAEAYDSSFRITGTGEFNGTADVETPAGTFDDCLVFTLEFTSEHWTADTADDPWRATNTLSLYLAANTGIVKQVADVLAADGESREVTVRLLTDYTLAGTEPGGFALSGRIVDTAGQPVAGVPVILEPGTLADTTNVDGWYSWDVANGEYTVIPVDDSRSFDPPVVRVNIASEDAAGGDITAQSLAPASQLLNAADYFPTATGDTWSYSGARDYCTDITCTPLNITVEVAGDNNTESVTWTPFQGGDIMVTKEYRIEDNRVLVKGFHVKSAFGPGINQLSVPGAYLTSGKEEVLFDFNRNPGETWMVDLPADNVTSWAKYLGQETVTGPDGTTWVGCCVFQLQSTTGSANPGDWTAVNTCWLAPGVGIVQMKQHVITGTCIPYPICQTLIYTWDSLVTLTESTVQ